jgi:dodecin
MARHELDRILVVEGDRLVGIISEAAIREALERANRTLRNIEGAWVKDMNILMENNQIVGYKVNLAVTFVLEDGA